MKLPTLIFDSDSIAFQKVIKIVDSVPEIENRYIVCQNKVCIVSDPNTKFLIDNFNTLLLGIRYLITEIPPERKGGRMQETVLDLLSSPGPVQGEPA